MARTKRHAATRRTQPPQDAQQEATSAWIIQDQAATIAALNTHIAEQNARIADLERDGRRLDAENRYLIDANTTFQQTLRTRQQELQRMAGRVEHRNADVARLRAALKTAYDQLRPESAPAPESPLIRPYLAYTATSIPGTMPGATPGAVPFYAEAAAQ